MYITNFFRHLKTVLKHKFFVAHYCFMCNLYLQGILHDMSKFSPVEFFESVKYYQGTRSPIDACKEVKGYSNAWFHHRGRNKHHWEYWVDDFQRGVIPKKMPFRYVLEMICDFLGAGRAYTGDKFSIKDEYDWWQNKKKTAIMHPDVLKLVDTIFDTMMIHGIEKTLSNKKFLHKLKRKYNKSPKRRHTMNEMTGIRTYQFTFTRPDTNKPDSTQFCANTQSDAYDLFKDFITFDEK